ncbi:FKBP-type peptidyl-prolyl cis-trans isomerase [Roseivirga pacifica]|uniref:FKBP-type peptidyl-prolyl cis-trans isomerase n=1 Tax=Roseivirga pacifica TaxID=1267423 RepID=UPI00227BBC54|nr:FKBP-type peptidyl-prolyl cis-trans isomerase [Roseivirga pacifica]
MKKFVLGLLAVSIFACKSDFEDYDPIKQLELDTQRIDEFLDANEIDAQIDESGIRYVILDKGNGQYPIEGQVVAVDYELWRFTGDLVDTSKELLAISEGIHTPQREYVPLEFELGAVNYIPGFQLSVMLLDENGEGDFYVPSVLAYKNAGTQNVGANENLYMKIRLVEIVD